MIKIKFLTLIALFLVTLSCVKKRKSFNSNNWKNWTESELVPSERWLMYNDLIKNYNLIGVNKESIKNILGKPNIMNQYEFQYNLGYSNKSSIDPSIMIIKFNNDTVVNINLLNE